MSLETDAEGNVLGIRRSPKKARTAREDVGTSDPCDDWDPAMYSDEIERGQVDVPAAPTTRLTPASDPLSARWQTLAEAGGIHAAPPPRRALLRRDGVVALALAIVGMLVAPGGRGKTMALIQLAIAVALGTRWLDVFEVARPGRVVLALAEEDIDEIRRRLYYAARALDLSDVDRRLAEDRIVPLGLSGEMVGLVQVDPTGAIVPSPVHATLLGLLSTEETSLVILDPLSRWAPNVETDNAGATAAIQALEQLTRAPGSPTVIVAHHTAKWSRREGNKGDSAGARGVTGLTDGVRWVAALEGSTEKDLALAIAKSNYGPKGEPVELVRDPDGGILRPPTAHERQRQAIDDVRRSNEARAQVLDAVRARPGIGSVDLRKAVKARASVVDDVLASLLSDGSIEDVGTASRHRYQLAEVPHE